MANKAFDTLFGRRAVMPYRVAFLGFMFIGAIGGLATVWNFADTLNGLMAAPNLIALIALAGVVARLVSDHGMSERRACRVLGVDRSTIRYRASRDDGALWERLREPAKLTPRLCFRLVEKRGSKHRRGTQHFGFGGSRHLIGLRTPTCPESLLDQLRCGGGAVRA